MEQTRHLRHDFKHSVHALSVLANSGDVENLKKYLADYEQQVLTLDKLRPFCKNAVLNALFHHYYAMAQSAEIRTEWHISIPCLLYTSPAAEACNAPKSRTRTSSMNTHTSSSPSNSKTMSSCVMVPSGFVQTA